MPKPTTKSPVIAPPRKASASAGARPPRAASAVRTLARTETIIPMKPAAPERVAPMTKPTADSIPMPKPISTARTMATMPIVMYWRRKNAIAPSWIAAAMARMRSLPSGWRRTQPMRKAP